MKQNIVSSEGRMFLECNNVGGIHPFFFEGLFFDDTRHLSLFDTRINDDSLELLDSSETSFNRSLFIKTNKVNPLLPLHNITLVEERIIDRGMYETFRFINNNNKEVKFTFKVTLDTDFVDTFEIKRGTMDPIIKEKVERKIDKLIENNQTIKFSYKNGGFSRETSITFSEKFFQDGDNYIFTLTIPAHDHFVMNMTLGVVNQKKEIFIPDKEIYNLKTYSPDKYIYPVFPELETDWYDLKKLYEQSIYDLSLLAIEYINNSKTKEMVPAAGFPWFMALFGRDSAITAYQMLGFDNQYSYGVLRALSEYQGKKVDHESEEEPGRILHEVRLGEQAFLKTWVKFPYYGTIDATPLFLKLFVGLRKYINDPEFFGEMKQPVLNALEWMGKYGDIDGDGFVEYYPKTASGLRNQNWRDSGDSMMFNNGDLADPPIASADVQGYVYDAKIGLAEIANFFWKDEELSKKLLHEAHELKKKFNEKFWIADKKFYAMGLDKDKKQIDTLSSMMGHLLWSEIVDKDKQSYVINALFSKELYTGWGIRTITKKSPRFNPMGYQLGTVWPHDNSIAIRGLFKAGFRNEALILVENLVEASKYYNYRLPELYAGYDKSETYFPVSFPSSASPQAWAASSTLQFIKTIMGVNVDYKNLKIRLEPPTCNKYTYIRLNGFDIYGTKYNLEIANNQISVQEIQY